MFIDDDNIDLNDKNIFFPEIIRNHIQKFSSTKYIYRFNIYDRIILIEFVFFNTIPSKKEMNSHLKKIYLWLHILSLYANSECTKTLKINIYFSNFKKKLPSNLLINKEQILDAINVNTAWTYRCKKHNSITIYRKEEWFKVLCHETIHTFGLDFSSDTDTNIKLMCEKIFNVQSDFLLSESYCEFWARFLNILFTLSFTNSYTKNRFILLLNNERKHTIKQAVNVLNHMNIDYLTINAQYKQYKENTNVFVYYISTAVLFYYPIDFVLWCYNNNSNILNFKKTNTNLRNLLNYYKSIYNSTELLETFSQVNKSSLTASLKMSIVDI